MLTARVESYQTSQVSNSSVMGQCPRSGRAVSQLPLMLATAMASIDVFSTIRF